MTAQSNYKQPKNTFRFNDKHEHYKLKPIKEAKCYILFIASIKISIAPHSPSLYTFFIPWGDSGDVEIDHKPIDIKAGLW